MGFRISSKQKEDLKVISNIEPTSLEQLLDELRNISTPLANQVELKKMFYHSLDKENGNILYRHIFSISTLLREHSITVDEFFTSMDASLGKSGWSSEELKKWTDISKYLKDILQLDVICLVTKILDLTYDYTNLLEKSRILTDVRPVFDEKKNQIIGSIVTQTLRLHYYSEDASHSLSITLDEKDLNTLEEACLDAKKKAKQAKDLMKEKCGIQSFIVGDSYYDEPSD